MICGVAALSSSHPAIIPALAATQEINPIMTRLFDRVCTVPSNRHRDPREDPIREKAVVVVEHGESAALQPE
jgi:hypothetical protein